MRSRALIIYLETGEKQEIQTMRNETGQFLPGHSGNPAGRPTLPEKVRAARNLSYCEMIQAVTKARRMTRAKAEKELAAPGIHLGRAAVLKAYLECDYQAIKVLEDRVFGKAPENINLELMADDGFPAIPKRVEFVVVEPSRPYPENTPLADTEGGN